jgi:hypothetical protein
LRWQVAAQTVHQFVKLGIRDKGHTQHLASKLSLQLTSCALMDDHPCLKAPLAELAKDVQWDDSLTTEAGGCVLCD